MNKLLIGKDGVYLDSDKGISLKEESKISFVRDLNLKVSVDSDLVIESDFESKMNIVINVLKGVKLNLYEMKKGGSYKVRYIFYLDKESILKYEKVNDVNNASEEIIFNLNGERSKVDFMFKTISKSKEKYNILVYHNAKNTFSNINNNGVNINDGCLEYNVSSFVPKKIVKCDVSQSARIINFSKNECIIKPNLFIDENDVKANHSAHIGGFSYDEVFYLMSRGIDEKRSKNILSKGFLLKGLSYHSDYVKSIIKKYWG